MLPGISALSFSNGVHRKLSLTLSYAPAAARAQRQQIGTQKSPCRKWSPWLITRAWFELICLYVRFSSCPFEGVLPRTGDVQEWRTLNLSS